MYFGVFDGYLKNDFFFFFGGGGGHEALYGYWEGCRLLPLNFTIFEVHFKLFLKVMVQNRNVSSGYAKISNSFGDAL